MKDIDLVKLKEDFSRIFGMMAACTNARSGRLVMLEPQMLRLLDFVRQTPDLIEQLEAAQRERDEWKEHSDKVYEAFHAEGAELKRRDAQKPVAWRVVYNNGNDFELCSTEREAKKWQYDLDDNGWPDVTPEALYVAAPAAAPLTTLTDEQIDAVLDSNGNMAYVIAGKRERLRMFAREILRTASEPAAPAAVLPSESSSSDAEQEMLNDRADAWDAGASWMRAQIEYLSNKSSPHLIGKVVKLPEATGMGVDCHEILSRVKDELDDAGVKWVEGE